MLRSQQIFIVHYHVVVATAAQKDNQSHDPKYPRTERLTLTLTKISISILHGEVSLFLSTLLITFDHRYHHQYP